MKFAEAAASRWLVFVRTLVAAGIIMLMPIRGAESTDRGSTPPPAAERVAPALPILAEPVSPGSVRLLDSPFSRAVAVNREYLLALEPDRLLAPFRREAGLPAKATSYGNWESTGLDGHTAGHYLAALASMIAAGADTSDGELQRRLGYLLDELELCQKAGGDGYLGGVPRSRELWKAVAAGDLGEIGKRWVPWYNVHKTFAGLRDVTLATGNPKALALLVSLGDWCVKVTSSLTEAQMQRMLATEYGGMNEVMADLYALTGERKYLETAERFNHHAVLDPLLRREDRLTGLHANTQIPKVTGFARLAALTGNQEQDAGARFFWETVTGRRSVAFGGNSVAEHFNAPTNFQGMLQHRQGPETCNTYNMLRLTERLFATQPRAAYADYYERALYNHLLASIHPTDPGYVYFTPIRPGHYRVYSQSQHGFWCCVGTGMENPGRYGAFIYARARDGVFVNLFIPSELRLAPDITLRQETRFPFEPRTRLRVKSAGPETLTLHIRHPAWVAAEALSLKVNGEPVPVASTPSAYASIRREWRDGDVLDVELPMRTTVERLPDGSDWVALLQGPIVLACPTSTENLVGLRADGSRMGHVPHGPLVPTNQVPVLRTTVDDLPAHVVPDLRAGPMRFRLRDVVEPPSSEGLPLLPFFELHDSRYQMYWELTTRKELSLLPRTAAGLRPQRVRMPQGAPLLQCPSTWPLNEASFSATPDAR